jgi:uncharacterized Zn-binding protein involved in type VI secretion
MSQPVARDGDAAACPHGLGSVSAAECAAVQVNKRGAARAGAPVVGLEAGATVKSGATSVRVNSLPLARMGDATGDGVLVAGSANVLVGGPSATIAGAIADQTDACKAAAKTRSSGKTSQSYGNCPLESWRNVINHARAAKGLGPVTEDELLKTAIDGGYAVNDPGKHDHGACAEASVERLLREQYGIESEVQAQTLDGVAAAVDEGRAVSITIHPYHWIPLADVKDTWFHEVAVTAVERDADGNVTAVFINDTGLGKCGLRLSKAQFDKNMPQGSTMLVSKEPQWQK